MKVVKTTISFRQVYNEPLCTSYGIHIDTWKQAPVHQLWYSQICNEYIECSCFRHLTVIIMLENKVFWLLFVDTHNTTSKKLIYKSELLCSALLETFCTLFILCLVAQCVHLTFNEDETSSRVIKFLFLDDQITCIAN